MHYCGQYCVSMRFKVINHADDYVSTLVELYFLCDNIAWTSSTVIAFLLLNNLSQCKSRSQKYSVNAQLIIIIYAVRS